MIEIPARQGKALRLRQGQKARVVNTKGQQVVDTWAFNAADLNEFMSMEHSRVAMGRIDLLDVTLECRYAGPL